MRGMRNSKRKTTDEKSEGDFGSGPFGVLSCRCDDGLPYGVPLSYALSGNALYFHCALQGQNWIILPVTIGLLYRCDLSGKLPGSAYLSI